MTVLKTVPLIFKRVKTDLEKKANSDIIFHFEYHNQIEDLVALLVGDGFKVVRKVSHIDHVPKEQAERDGFESLDYDNNDPDAELKWSETLVYAYFLMKNDEVVRVAIFQVAGEFCTVKSGNKDLLNIELLM